MNKDIAEGKWAQLSGRVKQKWAELTDDDIGEIQGRYEAFIGKLQSKYGMKREEAEQEWARFMEDDPDMRA